MAHGDCSELVGKDEFEEQCQRHGHGKQVAKLAKAVAQVMLLAGLGSNGVARMVLDNEVQCPVSTTAVLRQEELWHGNVSCFSWCLHCWFSCDALSEWPKMRSTVSNISTPSMPFWTAPTINCRIDMKS